MKASAAVLENQLKVPMRASGPNSVDALQGQLHEALNFDQKKKQINDAKLRAVHQKVEYEEFEKMVAGAHLKPIKPKSHESAAISKQFAGYVMPVYSSQTDAPAPAPPAAASLSAEQQFAPPTSSNDFLRTWRRQCKTPETKFRYLHTFEPDSLPLLFRSEMEPAVLDGIAQALQACALPPAGAAGEAELQEALWVELLLRYLCRINRFALTLDLADKGAPCPPRRPDDGARVCPTCSTARIAQARCRRSPPASTPCNAPRRLSSAATRVVWTGRAWSPLERPTNSEALPGRPGPEPSQTRTDNQSSLKLIETFKVQRKR